MRKSTFEIANAFRKYRNISFAILFGSQARMYQHPASDIDIAIYFDKKPSYEEIINITSDIAEILQIPEDKIDITILDHEISLELRYKIFRDGVIIFSREMDKLKRFRDLSLSLYLDYKIALEKVRYSEKFIKKMRAFLNGRTATKA